MAVSGHSRGSQLLEEWRGDAMQQIEASKLLSIDPVTYNRFKNGVRKPSAEIAARIERLTDGMVSAISWYQPPIKDSKRRGRAA